LYLLQCGAVSSDTRHDTPVAVASRSFSRDARLRAELIQRYPRVRFNETGHTLAGAALVDFLLGHTKAITGLETLVPCPTCASSASTAWAST